ncbi:5-formyltetrahydrofolate cyclo-ligase [Paenibacillus albiflavus]|nr:5-formyltetrahydrofolate cyclo-ligase [Paenibacillus albiflavus]
MNMYQRKIEMREQIELKRSSLNQEERQAREEQIVNQLIGLCKEHFKSSSDGCLMTYMPFRTEVDIAPVMEWCWSRGIRVVAPRTVKQTRQMILHEVTSYNDFSSGGWGIREPITSLPVLTDLSTIRMILVPGLAFDTKMARLGYGGGYYDRFFKLFAEQGIAQPLLVAASFDLQVVPEVPVSWNDVNMDILVTESLQLKASHIQ